MAPVRLLKLKQVMDLTGLRMTSVYAHAKDGRFTPPIKLTARSSAWPEPEVAAINQARIAGKSDAEIRALVGQLIAQRQQPQQAS